MIRAGANAPLTVGASSSALMALRGLTVGQWAGGTSPGGALAAQAAAVVSTIALRFGTDPGTVIRAIQHMANATGLPLLTVARQALVRPVVSFRQWRNAIDRFGWLASFVLRHPGQDLTDLSVSENPPVGSPIVTAVT